ncbi:PHB depolymerase family esterase [Mycobacterium sp. TY814]|uniref:PHB depolymerase family esterase n=1 Tax=unclassified Mycobacterium TaxID=2642494 RepID=UPI002740FD4D|nr:PHB depolymerase family esterase [Mycobacterium sp. TY814]MDP7723496.1 PHB depolymerase family esterase [Mycobacterium sp. TY814]
MSWAQRGLGITRELGMVLPRTVAGFNESTRSEPSAPRGVRQFGEVFLDELVLTGFSVLGGSAPRSIRSLDACAAAAEELSALGIDGAHAEPAALRVRAIKRRKIAGLAYERLSFEHDPALPQTLTDEGFGGPSRAAVHLCRHRDGPRPWLIWIHGAGQGGAEDMLMSRIDRIHHGLGFNVAMPIQPGHGSRKGYWPSYPDMDPLGNVAGMMRSVSEIRAVVRWARRQATAVVVAGVSMGSPVAALVSHLEREVDAVALYTPILGLNAMIARHLGRSGSSHREYRRLLQSEVVSRLTTVIDPLMADPAPPPQRRLIVAARHDRMAMLEPALVLQDKWGGQLHWYGGGHVSHVFSRRVQAISERFLREVRDDMSLRTAD